MLHNLRDTNGKNRDQYEFHFFDFQQPVQSMEKQNGLCYGSQAVVL